jgi:CheY-like chemotaxis protein
MDDYLSKPVDRKLLYEAISKWTQGRNSKGSDV